MKLLPILSATATLSLSSCLCSCGSPDAQQKASAVINRALIYAERKGEIAPEDVALVRDLNTIVLTPTAEPIPEITVTSSK